MKKTILLFIGILFATDSLCQTANFISDHVTAKIIQQGEVSYDTLKPGQAYVPLYLAVQGIGVMDTTKFAIIEYRVRIIEKSKPVVVDYGDPSIIYTGPWVHFTGSGFFGGNASYTLDANGSLSFEFTGNKIEWYTEKRFNHSIVSFSIDGVETEVDLYNPTTLFQQKVFEKKLSYGIHKVVIKNTGKKNPLATETNNLIHDYFIIYK